MSSHLLGCKFLVICNVHVQVCERWLVDALDMEDLLVEPTDKCPQLFVPQAADDILRHSLRFLIPSQVSDLDVVVINLAGAFVSRLGVDTLMGEGMAGGGCLLFVLLNDFWLPALFHPSRQVELPDLSFKDRCSHLSEVPRWLMALQTRLNPNQTVTIWHSRVGSAPYRTCGCSHYPLTSVLATDVNCFGPGMGRQGS